MHGDFITIITSKNSDSKFLEYFMQFSNKLQGIGIKILAGKTEIDDSFAWKLQCVLKKFPSAVVRAKIRHGMSNRLVLKNHKKFGVSCIFLMIIDR